MRKRGSSCQARQEWRCLSLPIEFIFISVLTFSGAGPLLAQPNAERRDQKPAVLSIAYFIESANNSVNSLTSLLKKDNYRNKITSLNNPVNTELGFSLKNEILVALKPILDKVKKTDGGKFRDVIENFLSKPEENGIKAVKKYMPSLGIFSTVLSLVGNLVIVEKSITKEDLNQFTARVEQYFYQYEKLNAINEHFADEVEKLLTRSSELKEDLKDFLHECISTMNPRLTKALLKDMPVEALLQKYYDPQKLPSAMDTCLGERRMLIYPPDAPTSVKLIAAGIKRIQKDFENIYRDNYTEMKELIANLKTAIANLDQNQLNKTSTEIELLYTESRQADVVNLNSVQVNERMMIVCSVINAGK